MKKGTIFAVIGLILPQFILSFKILSFFGNATGFIGFSYLYALGYMESNGFFGLGQKKTEIMFKLFDINWYLDPSNIIGTLSDLKHAVNYFLLDFYGNTNHNNEIVQSIEGILFGLSFILLAVGIIFSLLEKNQYAIISEIGSILLSTGSFLSYYANSDAYNLIIPFGVVVIAIAVFFEWKERS